MKFLAVFAAILAVACAGNTWTLDMLSEATQSPYTDATLKPYLEAALNDMMQALWAGQTVEPVTVTIPSLDFSSMTLDELSAALQDPNTDPALVPLMEAALNQMMQALWTGVPVEAAVAALPAMEIHYYTLNELSLALQDPTTNPQLIPYLEHALNELMAAMYSGQDMSAVVVAVPAGLNPVDVPADNEVVVPVVPEVPVSPVDAVATPEAPASPASPLVQIIININQQQEAAAVAPVSPVIVPAGEATVDPVQVVDSAPIVNPIQVVDTAPVVDPVQVVDSAPVVAEPVQVVEPIVAAPVIVVEAAAEAIEPVIVAQPVFEVAA